MPKNSIRRKLLARLMLPLLGLVLATVGAAYGLARHFSERVLDQWLYDSVISFTKQINWVKGKSSIEIAPSAVAILEWDVADRVYFEIASRQRGHMFGNVAFPPPPSDPEPGAAAVYYDSAINGEGVRAVAVALTPSPGETMLATVAETHHKRNQLAAEAAWWALALSLPLVAMVVVLIWTAVGSGMASLENAVRHLRRQIARAPLTATPSDAGIASEVRPLVAEVDALMKELAAVNRSQERFVLDAAHQLRTPLASLRVRIDLARREHDPERRAEALKSAADVLSRTSYLLHQLLTLAQVEGSPIETRDLEPTDVDLLARDVAEQHIDAALARGVDLGYDGPGKPVLIRGKEVLLREALVNLLDNALKYGASGGQVTVGVRDDPPEIYVEDRGPGIPPAERERVRERFYRIPGSQADGCGLGLAIVAEIAQRHGASLSFEEGPDRRGLRARVTFPAAT